MISHCHIKPKKLIKLSYTNDKEFYCGIRWRYMGELTNPDPEHRLFWFYLYDEDGTYITEGHVQQAFHAIPDLKQMGIEIIKLHLGHI